MPREVTNHVAAVSFVMPGFMPGIHVLPSAQQKTWMAGTSPAMTTVGALCSSAPAFVRSDDA